MEATPTATLNHPRPNGVWTLIIAYIIAAILLFLLNSCSCDYHLRKAKAKCGYSSKVDTLWLKDTIITHEYHKDTVFHELQKDTVFIHDGKLTIKYFKHDSLVYLQGKCAADTIVKNVPVIINKTEIKESYVSYLKWIAVIMGLLIGFKVINKFIKI